MKKVVDDVRLIFKCCKLYYEDGIGQQEIANKFGISRVSVSRMLQTGRKMGMVQIQVISPNQMTYTSLEQQLEKAFGLKEAIVVENSPLLSEFDQYSMMGTEAIKLLEHYLHDGDNVGVSMGMTLSHVCSGTRQSTDPINCTFIPVLGGVSTGVQRGADIHANQVALDFANLFGGKYVECFSPAIFSNKEIKEAFMKEKPMRHFLKYYENLKTVILGIGTPNRAAATIIKDGYVTVEEVDELVKKGVVGDIILQFFDIYGNPDKYKYFNDRVVGMTIDQLKSVENRIGIGNGKYRAEAIFGALNGGLINVLITDEETAKIVLKMKEES